MLKADQQTIDDMEKRYPGVREMILRFEEEELPICPRCGSENTADVQLSMIGRTIIIAAATTKFKLVPTVPSQVDTSVTPATSSSIKHTTGTDASSNNCSGARLEQQGLHFCILSFPLGRRSMIPGVRSIPDIAIRVYAIVYEPLE